jgi:adenylyltransferase/sulfurtransferase
VIEGADNLATKFLAADACFLTQVPLVQAGVVRWDGWALGWAPQRGAACLRCVFEDIPQDRVETCADAGVVGPAVGVVGALQSAIALELLQHPATAPTPMWSYSALQGRVRRFTPQPRSQCPLCSGEISELKMERYQPPEYAA